MATPEELKTPEDGLEETPEQAEVSRQLKEMANVSGTERLQRAVDGLPDEDLIRLAKEHKKEIDKGPTKKA